MIYISCQRLCRIDKLLLLVTFLAFSLNYLSFLSTVASISCIIFGYSFSERERRKDLAMIYEEQLDYKSQLCPIVAGDFL
jgi:hypothetical protein